VTVLNQLLPDFELFVESCVLTKSIMRRPAILRSQKLFFGEQAAPAPSHGDAAIVSERLEEEKGVRLGFLLTRGSWAGSIAGWLGGRAALMRLSGPEPSGWMCQDL
jgi:hypothetical protein